MNNTEKEEFRRWVKEKTAAEIAGYEKAGRRLQAKWLAAVTGASEVDCYNTDWSREPYKSFQCAAIAVLEESMSRKETVHKVLKCCVK